MGHHPNFDHHDYMRPAYHYYWRHHHRFGVFRRVFWFSFGAFSALAFVRHHGHGRFTVEDRLPPRHWDDWHGAWGHGFGGCRRVEYLPRLEPPATSQPRAGAQEKEAETEKPVPVPVQAATGQSLAPPHPPPVFGTAIPPVERPIDASIRELGRNASDRMSELSESTIDSLLAVLIGFKSRIVQARLQQQQQQQQQQSQQPSSRLSSSEPPHPPSGRMV